MKSENEQHGLLDGDRLKKLEMQIEHFERNSLS